MRVQYDERLCFVKDEIYPNNQNMLPQARIIEDFHGL